jgi:hypothetical protein
MGGSYEIFAIEHVGKILADLPGVTHNVHFLWLCGKIPAGVPRWRVGRQFQHVHYVGDSSDENEDNL